MIRMALLVCVQSLFLCGGQVLLKLAMAPLPKFCWSREYLKIILTDWWLMACGVSFGIAGVMWMYILKNFPFHQVYPMTAVAYIFGMLASMWVFGESVPPVRWLGVLLIMAGCVFILK